jgi:hypothetical protein
MSSKSQNHFSHVDGTRGSILWGFNRFRSDALVQLLNDLVRLEQIGLPDAECQQVKDALIRILKASGNTPATSWLRSFVTRDLEEFANLYSVWNSHAGPDAGAARKRGETLKQMQRRRHRLARKIRSNQLILATELDARLIGEIYLALEDLSSSMPEVFKRLSEAVNRYNRVVE